jgi:hypothetical protein
VGFKNKYCSTALAPYINILHIIIKLLLGVIKITGSDTALSKQFRINVEDFYSRDIDDPPRDFYTFEDETTKFPRNVENPLLSEAS